MMLRNDVIKRKLSVSIGAKVELWVLLILVLVVCPQSFGQLPAVAETGTGMYSVDLSVSDVLVRFYSIGSLYPDMSAGDFTLTENALSKWRKLEPQVQALAQNGVTGQSSDAQLLLAVATWLYDRDPERAVAMAQVVIDNNPSAPSILSFEPDDAICPVRLNYNLYIHFHRLLYGPAWEDSVLSGEVYGWSSSRETYAEHMMQHPNYVADIAALFICAVAEREQISVPKEELLQSVLLRHSPTKMRELAGLDKELAESDYRLKVREFIRPEVVATLELMRRYRGLADWAKALQIGFDLVDAISADGFYWQIHWAVGDLMAASKGNAELREAEEQYRIALNGFTVEIQRVASQMSKSGGEVRFPIESWEGTIVLLKQAIVDAGGTIAVTSEEVGRIVRQLEVSPELPSLSDRLRMLYRREKACSDAAVRKATVIELTSGFLDRVRSAASGDRLRIIEERAKLAGALVLLAGIESDPDARNAMLDAVRDLIRMQSAELENVQTDDSWRQKVDQLIMQISGEDILQQAIPHPVTQLATTPSSALLYASQRVQEGNFQLDVKRDITMALANSENPVLYDFFLTLMRESEDDKLTGFAACGLVRIIKNADIDENGVIDVSRK